MDHQDLRRAYSSGQEGHGVHVCRKCGWPFPNAHPSARHRRAHKKICGTVDGYTLVDSTQHSVSDDDQRSDDDNHDPITPSPKVVERSVYEKGSGVMGQGSIQSDDGVFVDAVADFSDTSNAERSGVGFEDARESHTDVERGAEKDLSPIPFPIDGKTAEDYEPVIYTSEDMKNTNVTDSLIESCLTSVDQEVEVAGITATNFMSDSKTQDSNLGDTDGLHPRKKEMMTYDASEINEKTGDTDSIIESCLTSVDQDAELAGIRATNLDRNLILPKKVSRETVEGGSKFEESYKMTSEDAQEEVVPSVKEHSDGFDIHFPQIDVPPEEDSVADVNTSFDSAEKKVNDTDATQYLNSGEAFESHNGTKGETASVHVLFLPDDLHVVEDPVAMLEDFKDHKGKQLDRFTSCSDSWEQFEDEETNVKHTIFNENSSMLESSRLSGFTVVSPHMQNLEDSLESDGSRSKPMTKSMPDEGEVNMSQSEIKIKNRTSDEIGALADASMPLTASTYVVDFPEGQKSDDKSNEFLQLNFAASDAGIDQTTLSVVLGDKKNNGIEGSGESPDDNSKSPGEESTVENLIAIAQSTDFHDDQIYPAAKVQKDDDTGDHEDIIEKFNKFGDAGYDQKDETFTICGEETSKGTGEKFSGDPTSSLETVSSLPEFQVNPVTILQEGGDVVSDCEKHKTSEFDSIGYESDLEKDGKCASPGEDLSKQFTEKSFVEDPTSSVDSAISLSDSQVHLTQNLPDADGSTDHDDGKVEKTFVSGNESIDGYVEENILGKPDLTPESSVTLANDVVEDATDGSRIKMVKTSSRDLDISSDSIQLAGEVLSVDQRDAIVDEIACSDKIKREVNAHVAADGQNVASSQKTLDDNEKRELGFSSLDTESLVQSFIGSQEVPAVASGTSSEFLVEGGDDNLVRQQPSPTAIDVDSNSQTDSLEANWGSFSVLSMQSDSVTVSEAPPRSNSQTSYEENSALKKSITDFESPYSDKSSDMFEAPSFMTLVEPRGADDKKTPGSDAATAVQNPELPKPVSLQTGWFPSMTQVANESEGRKKNEEIIAKVTNWNTDKPHSPLKSLLGEASSKGKLLNQKESLDPAPQKDEKPAKVSGAVKTTVNSILKPESPTEPAAKKEHAKEWNSPARYPADTKSEKKKAKGRPSWVQFVCCASVKQQ